MNCALDRQPEKHVQIEVHEKEPQESGCLMPIIRASFWDPVVTSAESIQKVCEIRL